jgi:hypothetical protein
MLVGVNVKRLLALVLVVLTAGCDQSQTQSVGQCGSEDTSEAADPLGNDAGPECVPDHTVITELPTVSMGTMQTICSVCDEGHCDDLGDPCTAYGSQCDFNGAQGVCVACCNGETGELHCSPVP